MPLPQPEQDPMERIAENLEELGYRMGLRPQDIGAMTPCQLQRMWDGYVWRKQQQLDELSTALWWLRSLVDSDADSKVIRGSFGWETT